MYHAFIFLNFHHVFLPLITYKNTYMNNTKKLQVAILLSAYKVLTCFLSTKNEN